MRLAVRRAYERALDGEAEVTVRDAVALLRLQREIDREAAGQAAGTTAQWQAALREVLSAARRHLGEHWKPFVADIRANQQLAAMWGLPGEAGPGRAGSPGPGQSITLDCPSGQKPITPASSDLEELLRGLRRAGGESGVQG